MFWRFDPATLHWERLDTRLGGPQPAARRCCGFVALGGRLHLWGGSGVAAGGGRLHHTFLNDFWTFDPDSCTWQCLEASEDFRQAPVDARVRPGPRYTPVLQRLGSTLALFGGYTEDRLGARKLNDLWIWTPDQGWRGQATPRQHGGRATAWPGPRYGAMSAADDRHLYVCGGADDDGDHIDVWAWEAATGRWTLLAPGTDQATQPSPRYCAAAALHDGGFWLFGGRSRRHAKRNFNDTWRFDLASCRWQLVMAPANLDGYSAASRHVGYHAKSAYAVIDDSWYLWGGEGLHGHVSDMWVFRFRRGTWSLVYPARPDDPHFW